MSHLYTHTGGVTSFIPPRKNMFNGHRSNDGDDCVLWRYHFHDQLSYLRTVKILVGGDCFRREDIQTLIEKKNKKGSIEFIGGLAEKQILAFLMGSSNAAERPFCANSPVQMLVSDLCELICDTVSSDLFSLSPPPK